MSEVVPLRLRDVTVRLGGATVLAGVDLDVPRGAITVVTGPSGSGKSTLLRLCNRLVVPSAGTVAFEGQDLAERSPDDIRRLRRRVGMVFQRPVLFAGTVRSNLTEAAPELDDAAVARALRDAALDPALADRDVDTLSGGEAQRVCLARTLVTAPTVLLADEPTSSLDDDATRQLEDLVTGLAAEGTSVLWVSHDTAQAERIADARVVLRDGRIQRSTDGG